MLEVIRCLMVDDEKLAREELARLLGVHSHVEIVGEARRVDEALELTMRLQPDVVFLDIRLRVEDGFDYIHRASGPLPHIIFITAHDEFAVRAFECHALDYLLKPVNPDRLTAALQRVAAHIKISSRARDYASLLRIKIGEPARLEKLGLTPREAEVLFWVAHGKSNPEIARLLGKSAETVKKQIQNILNKLEIKTRVQAAVLASEALQLRRK
jgi:DNA-binding NarL/FixJ family response regulator